MKKTVFLFVTIFLLAGLQSCKKDVYGCMNPTATNYNPNANIATECFYPNIYGCTDPTAENYNPNATVQLGSCEYKYDFAIWYTLTTAQQLIDLGVILIEIDIDGTTKNIQGSTQIQNNARSSGNCLAGSHSKTFIDEYSPFILYSAFAYNSNGDVVIYWSNSETLAIGCKTIQLIL